MRISDWSSDVCSSDLRAAYDSRFTQHESEVYAGASVAGAPRDSVDAYFAMRKISIGPGKVKGQPAILLNNEPVFQNGTLDQGWWPDGLYTPPSEEAMKSDLVFLKDRQSTRMNSSH